MCETRRRGRDGKTHTQTEGKLCKEIAVVLP